MIIISTYKRIYINGEPTKYLVNEKGEVKSYNRKKEKVMKVYETDKWYQYVKLSFHGKTKAEFIHRLVAKNFIPNPENKPEVNHKDCDKHNNYVANLEWVTSKENKDHALKNNRMHYLEGEESSKNVYSKKIIKKACKMMMKNELPMKEISKRTGIPIDSLYDIRCGRSWRSVAKEYTFPEIPTRQKGSSYIEKDIRKVCKLLEKGKLSNKEISDRTGVKISTVNDVKHKRRWTYVSEDYSI